MRTEAYKRRQCEAKREERRWYKAHGVCVQCHQRDAVPGMAHCGECLYGYTARRLAGGDEYREYRRAYMRKYRAEHKMAGLCAECSQPALPGLTRCKKHRLTHNVQTEKHRAHVVPDRSRCYVKSCTEPPLPGKWHCEKHYREKCAIAIANGMRNNANHIWRKYNALVFRKGDGFAGSAD